MITVCSHKHVNKHYTVAEGGLAFLGRKLSTCRHHASEGSYVAFECISQLRFRFVPVGSGGQLMRKSTARAHRSNSSRLFERGGEVIESSTSQTRLPLLNTRVETWADSESGAFRRRRTYMRTQDYLCQLSTCDYDRVKHAQNVMLSDNATCWHTRPLKR